MFACIMHKCMQNACICIHDAYVCKYVDGDIYCIGCWVTAADGSRYQVIERSCAALPFGYTNSPFLWTKVIKTLAKAMRRAGIRCLWYIDDACCALPSRAEALAARDLIEQMFAASGLAKAPDKGVWEPTQVLPDHLGFEVSTASLRGHLKVPARRCRDIASAASRLLHHASSDHRRKVSSEDLRVFVGKAVSVSAACDQARFRLRTYNTYIHAYTHTHARTKIHICIHPCRRSRHQASVLASGHERWAPSLLSGTAGYRRGTVAGFPGIRTDDILLYHLLFDPLLAY